MLNDVGLLNSWLCKQDVVTFFSYTIQQFSTHIHYA